VPLAACPPVLSRFPFTLLSLISSSRAAGKSDKYEHDGS
jgi:hypothetical protein